ncbi:MAG TPA: polyprenyl diphosphate synthase [Deltaproteobacteria bacterium]|nr:polyprenyl diphosphate synthase [Deltaproteobacteria bacterium]
MQNSIAHIAIIMDGNGRWAQKRGMPRIAGHESGSRTARAIVEAAKARGIPYLTLYAFSSENWQRPREEIDALFKLLERFIDDEVGKLKDSGVCIQVIGDITRLSEVLQDKIRRTIEETRGNDMIHLTIALNYGGRDEIVRAAAALAEEGVRSIDETVFAGRLDTASMPDPDLLIRTGGEFRISNFMLWQLAYTEMYFTDTLWPDFDEHCLDDALAWYASRQRRFGMTAEQILEKTTP